MSEQVRVGIVGTSWYTDVMHLPNFKSHPHAVLAAICGRTRERAEELAAKYAIPLVFTDYREMIEQGNLHALVISAPDDLHYSMTMDALDAGLHILCEKPLALNVMQASAMYEKAEAVGVKHMTYFTFRWLPHYRYLRMLLDEDYVGRCFHVHFRYLAGYGRRDQYTWRFDRKRANGALGDMGSHMIDLARWLVGDIAKVCAHHSVFIDRQGSDDQPLEPANDTALLVLEFANGIQGTIQVSAVAHVGKQMQEQQISLYGESGTLKAHFPLAGLSEIYGASSSEDEFDLLAIPDHFWGDVSKDNPFGVFLTQSVGSRLFIDSIIEDRPVSPSFYDGLKAQEVIDAAFESYAAGRWVSL